MCYQTDEAGEEEWDTGKIAIKEGLKNKYHKKTCNDASSFIKL